MSTQTAQAQSIRELYSLPPDMNRAKPNAMMWSLVNKPVIINAPGVYLTRSGEQVSIYRASFNHDFNCQGKYASGQHENWHKSGRLYFTRECENDIVSKA